ncbi:MAG TPA: Re/Si-specific NAD(P)(+) transhydrogenase subunit alpha, partial [Polyangiaceae bacterium]|nr:Re/Si-specific NAD(P)(+) transhydrogenase subunit alpha [Polyangiaceae bacterium]
MKAGIVKEIRADEQRVATAPDGVKALIDKLGFEVVVEAGAGAKASFSDQDYEKAGAKILPSAEQVWAEADIVLKLHPPAELPDGTHEADRLREGGKLISFIWPARNAALLERLKARKATVLAMDQVPRVSRAQKLDALSSMANIAGYRAVIEAATLYGRFFTGQMTAAGKVPPAKVLIIGAGVAGLAAIGAARGLGAIVRAFDTRPVVKEQVQSMGAEFLELDFHEDGTGAGGYAKEMSKAFIDAEMALFRAQAKEVDIIITTALIPGKPAPKLILKDMVELMNPGSVIVDLAAESGGNCEVTAPGKVIQHHGVHVVGYADLPSRLPQTASQLYGNNIRHFLSDLGGAEKFKIDTEDDVVRGALVMLDGELMWPPPPPKHPPEPPKASIEKAAPAALAKPSPAELARKRGRQSSLVLGVLAVFLTLMGLEAPSAFLSHLTVFVL